jgi:hypothetical protein
VCDSDISLGLAMHNVSSLTWGCRRGLLIPSDRHHKEGWSIRQIREEQPATHCDFNV